MAEGHNEIVNGLDGLDTDDGETNGLYGVDAADDGATDALYRGDTDDGCARFVPEVLKIDEDGEEVIEEHVDTRCGLGTCRPGFLQRCNNPTVLLGCLCMYTMIHG